MSDSPSSSPHVLAEAPPASPPPPSKRVPEATIRLESPLGAPEAAGPASRRLPAATVKLTLAELAEFAQVPRPAPAPTPTKQDTQRSSFPPSMQSVQVPPRRPRARRRHAAVVALGVVFVLSLAAFCVVAVCSAQNQRWLAPTVLSSTDARVVQVAATLQQETARKNELLLEQTDIDARLKEAKRGVTLEEAFQTSFRAAMQNDLASLRVELRRLQTLVDANEGDGKATSQDAADLRAKLTAVRARIHLLDEASRGLANRYGSLTLRREYDRSIATLENLRDRQTALEKAQANVRDALVQKNTLLEAIENSPYRLAIQQDVTLGFVPYENLKEVKTGEPVFACKTSLLFCRNVGEVGAVLPGEVRGTHPDGGGKELRGQLVRLLLSEPHSAERPILYAHRKPL